MRAELGPLAPGARVALVAPAGPPPPEQLDRAIELITRWGLEPVPGGHLREKHQRAEYLAGSDADRAADLQNAWCDPSIDAVFCVRGGYGSVRLLGHLELGAMKAARPKPLYGSSDVTAIHEFWFHELRSATWFAPMLATGALLDDDAATENLRQAVFEPWPGRSFTSDAAETLVPGTAQGVLVGGNLSVLAMTLGAEHRTSDAETDSQPRIGLLEDVTEEPYRIDGFLMSLLRAGWFDSMTAIALGSWLDCGEPLKIKALVSELLAPLGIPVVWELGFGHGAGAQTLPLGVHATLHADDAPRLVIGDR